MTSRRIRGSEYAWSAWSVPIEGLKDLLRTLVNQHEAQHMCRTPFRRQRRTVSAGMLARAYGQHDPRVDHTIHQHRSRDEHWGRVTDCSEMAS